MNTETILVEQKSLSSRVLGSQIRSKILISIENGNKVTLDLKNAEFISGSFADELFGVLVEWNGLDWFKNNIKVLMTEPFVKTKILESIEYRQNLQAKKIA